MQEHGTINPLVKVAFGPNQDGSVGDGMIMWVLLMNLKKLAGPTRLLSVTGSQVELSVHLQFAYIAGISASNSYVPIGTSVTVHGICPNRVVAMMPPSRGVPYVRRALQDTMLPKSRRLSSLSRRFPTEAVVGENIAPHVEPACSCKRRTWCRAVHRKGEPSVRHGRVAHAELNVVVAFPEMLSKFDVVVAVLLLMVSGLDELIAPVGCAAFTLSVAPVLVSPAPAVTTSCLLVVSPAIFVSLVPTRPVSVATVG
ncbi:hypothetical protein BDZ88DRAFT_101975 [Geranomyces variabilis]|nr:hypothetical protein BDZ88DRAFT_101975 [Geranomyces variabilis]